MTHVDTHPGESALDQDTLLAALDYDPSTGEFRWLDRGDRSRHWNRRYAGQVAGCASTQGGVRYRQINLNGYKYGAHRMAALWMTGTWPPEEVDHRNGDTCDNRWHNLRFCHRSLIHARIDGRDHQVRFKGVCLVKHGGRDGKYRARIKVMGRDKHLGVFPSAEEAHTAYVVAARQAFGQFANPGTAV